MGKRDKSKWMIDDRNGKFTQKLFRITIQPTNGICDTKVKTANEYQ